MRQGSTTPYRAAVLGLVTVLGTTLASAQAGTPLPAERLGVRTAPLLLLSRPDIRADLGLSEAQAVSAEAAIAQLYAKAAALKGKTGPEAIEGRKAVDEAQRHWIESNLTAVQRDRLIQIDLQWEGPSALISRPVIADSLGLNPTQQQQIREAVQRRNAAKAESSESAAKADSELARTTLSVLDEAQRSRWKSMLGKPYVPQTATAPNPATGTVR